jgi:hypothetical protein
LRRTLLAALLAAATALRAQAPPHTTRAEALVQAFPQLAQACSLGDAKPIKCQSVGNPLLLAPRTAEGRAYVRAARELLRKETILNRLVTLKPQWKGLGTHKLLSQQILFQRAEVSSARTALEAYRSALDGAAAAEVRQAPAVEAARLLVMFRSDASVEAIGEVLHRYRLEVV